MTRTKVFISYSHKDEIWKDRLMTHLAVLQFEGLIHVWADTQITVGRDWQESIDDAMNDSRVAVLLISPDFLSSEFIVNNEVPQILQLHAERGMQILPLIARPCAWKVVPWLSRIQVRPTGGEALALKGSDESDQYLAMFIYEIATLIKRFEPKMSIPVANACKQIDNIIDDFRRANNDLDDSIEISTIGTAIELGAPMYNEGSPMNCAMVYQHASQRLSEVIRESRLQDTYRKLGPNVREAERILANVVLDERDFRDQNFDELAWNLRGAFDQILEVMGPDIR